MEIIDAHHHLWDKRLERIPYQRYLLPELLADVNQGHNVRSTVFVEARVMYRPTEPVELRTVGEVDVRARTGIAPSRIRRCSPQERKISIVRTSTPMARG